MAEIIIDPIRRMDDQALLIYSRKFTLPLPIAFIEDNKLKPRDEIEIYRDRVNGRDALIIIPKIKEQTEPEKKVSEQVISES